MNCGAGREISDFLTSSEILRVGGLSSDALYEIHGRIVSEDTLFDLQSSILGLTACRRAPCPNSLLGLYSSACNRLILSQRELISKEVLIPTVSIIICKYHIPCLLIFYKFKVKCTIYRRINQLPSRSRYEQNIYSVITLRYSRI